MLRWFRIVLSALALAAFAVPGAGGAVAAMAGHSCESMSAVGDEAHDCAPGQDDRGAALPRCAEFACGLAQPLPPPAAPLLSRVAQPIAAPALLRESPELGGLSGPPELRPPIA